MNKNTVKAIQARITRGESDFVIGDHRYVCHYDHPAFEPFVFCYWAGGLQYNAGNIVNGVFIPAADPILRTHEGGEIETLAWKVRKAANWNDCIDEFNELMNQAGRKLREMVNDGGDCSKYFSRLRRCANSEFLEDTPDVSEDTLDLIDWLRDGAETADACALGYFIQDLLQVDLGL